MTFNIAMANESARKVLARQQRRLRWPSRRYAVMPITPEHREYNGNSVARIRTVISPWFRDENGIPTRTVTAT
jgi:hypothetical protein